MKNRISKITMWAGLLFIAIGLSKIITPNPANAQSLGVNPTTILSSCPAPQAAWLYICQVANDPANPAGAYVTANGAGYFLLQKAGGSGGVASYNGRTGNVVPTTNDYSYSQLSGKPTTISCSTSSQSNSGFTASGCTIQ